MVLEAKESIVRTLQEAKALLKECKSYPIPYDLKSRIRDLLGEDPPDVRADNRNRRSDGPMLFK